MVPVIDSFSRGDVLLVKFVFADEQGVKQRPCVIVSSDDYHGGRHEVILAAITSNVGRLLVGDHKLEAWRESGLLFPSVVTGVVRTVKRDMIAGKVGALSESDLRAVDDKLRQVLGL
jgi:mRNA-degrading endonuclease toxin of MazEF toxin-antitoxin module